MILPIWSTFLAQHLLLERYFDFLLILSVPFHLQLTTPPLFWIPRFNLFHLINLTNLEYFLVELTAPSCLISISKGVCVLVKEWKSIETGASKQDQRLNWNRKAELNKIYYMGTMYLLSLIITSFKWVRCTFYLLLLRVSKVGSNYRSIILFLTSPLALALWTQAWLQNT